MFVIEKTLYNSKLHQNCTKTAPTIHHYVLHTFINIHKIDIFDDKSSQIPELHQNSTKTAPKLHQNFTKDNSSNCVCVYVSIYMCFAEENKPAE